MRNDAISHGRASQPASRLRSTNADAGTGEAPFTAIGQDGVRLQFGPRLGLLHRDSKTVIRAGGGIFYSFKTVTSAIRWQERPVQRNAGDRERCEKTLRRETDFRDFRRTARAVPIAGSGFYYWPQIPKRRHVRVD